MRFSIGFVCICLFGSTIQAQDPYPINPLILEGTNIDGIGMVQSIENLAINDFQRTLIEVDTDFADTNRDGVLLFDLKPFIREGTIGEIDAPMDAFVDFFDSVTINNLGTGGFNFFIDPFPGTEDSGIYIDNQLLIQEFDLSTASDFSPDTRFIGFFDVKVNDNEKLMTVASVDDPQINSSVDRAIMIVDESSQLVVAKEGDLLSGQTFAVVDFETGPHESAFNNNDQVLFVAELDGPASTDHAIYLDEKLIAQEGSPSPVKGRSYENLSSRSLDLNDFGSFVFKANLLGDTTDDEVLIVNNEVFKREGDPGPNGFTITGFGTSDGPLKIGNDGAVLWFGEWDDPNTDQNSGLFHNDELIVQEGVSTVNGQVIESIASFTDQFTMSSDGVNVLFEASLAGGINGAFLIEVSFILGDVNCDGIVDLFDVAPFVELIVSGEYSAKADINADGSVDLLDVDPFIPFLTGG